MKITDVQVHRMSAPDHMTGGTNWLFVRIDTDTGIVGWGEGSLQYKDAALEAEILDFGKFLIGQDPRRIEHIWTSLYRRVTWTGGAVTLSAIAAIDLALWDIKARALGVPVYELAGGPLREKVRTYANGWFAGLETPNEFAAAALDHVAKGWRAFKLYPFIGEQSITPERLDAGIAVVRAVREAVGPDIELAVDIRCRLDAWSARRVADRLAPYDLAWLEEPVMWDNPAALAALAREIDIPVSAGEQLYTRWDFEPLLREQAVRILQPDICHAGGFSETRKIANLAEIHYASIAPHNSNGPISTVASLHLDLAIPNVFMQEIFVSFRDRYTEVLTNDAVIEDGYAAPPAGPGWGTAIDLDKLAQFPPRDFVQVVDEPYLDF